MCRVREDCQGCRNEKVLGNYGESGATVEGASAIELSVCVIPLQVQGTGKCVCANGTSTGTGFCRSIDAKMLS